MGREVTAICEKQCFDNALGRLYYQGEEAKIDLDSDVALSFKLSPDDREEARALQKIRVKAREDEKKEAYKNGFTVVELRKYKAEFGKEATV